CAACKPSASWPHTTADTATNPGCESRAIKLAKACPGTVHAPRPAPPEGAAFSPETRAWASGGPDRAPGETADSVLGKNAEGEIRTPEGLAAHQISSLARWTGLRYLSGSTSPAPRN